jgi:hypothetical protein
MLLEVLINVTDSIVPALHDDFKHIYKFSDSDFIIQLKQLANMHSPP